MKTDDVWKMLFWKIVLHVWQEWINYLSLSYLDSTGVVCAVLRQIKHAVMYLRRQISGLYNLRLDFMAWIIADAWLSLEVNSASKSNNIVHCKKL